MKNVFKVLGIIALVAVIGFSMAACGGNGGTDTSSGGGGSGAPNFKYAETRTGSRGYEVYIRFDKEITVDGVVEDSGSYTTDSGGFTIKDQDGSDVSIKSIRWENTGYPREGEVHCIFTDDVTSGVTGGKISYTPNPSFPIKSKAGGAALGAFTDKAIQDFGSN